jgi:uncharacterized protein (DUF885 family)
MNSTRRQLLLGAAAAVLPLTACATPKPAAPPAPPQAAMPPVSEDAKFATMLNGIADDILQETPEAATGLGLDTGARAALKAQLSDASWQAVAKDAQECAERTARLKELDRAKLSAKNVTLYDSVVYALGLGVEGGQFPFGENTFGAAMGESATPYVVSQQSGAYSGFAEFLNAQHKIETAADCEAYLARMEQYPRVLDQESERVRRDMGQGVVAPDFLLDTTLKQMVAARNVKAEETGLVTSLATRATAKGIAGDWTARATKLVSEKIQPALGRQIETMKAARAKAGHDAGVWKLPNGEAYYNWFLKVGTTTTLAADQIHKIGLDQHKEIDARMDEILRKQGLTKGSVGARVTALTKDKRYLFPDNDKGRAELIAYAQGRVDAVRPLLAKVSRMSMKAPVQVKRVPPDIQDGAGLGYMNFASLDGSRPAIYYINLKSTSLWPRWSIPTLTAHETIPGHAWQGAYLAEHHDEVPLISSLMGFNAFVEGWALYAEQLVDELGYYDNDPLGRLGMYQALSFRAARLVVDTGLHSKRWSREQAVNWMQAATGRAHAAVVSEVDRYCSGPGQACGYKIGHNELIRMRAKMKAALGDKYDVRDFDDVVVQTGGAPLTVLESAIDRFIAANRA